MLKQSGQRNPGYSQRCMAFCSRDRLFTCSMDNRVLRWDVDAKSRRPLFTLEGVIGLDILPDGQLLMTATEGGKVNSWVDLWDVETGAHVRTVVSVKSTEEAFSAMAPSRDGRLVALAQHDTGVQIRDVETGDLVQQVSLTKVASLTVSPDGSLLALPSSAKTQAF